MIGFIVSWEIEQKFKENKTKSQVFFLTRQFADKGPRPVFWDLNLQGSSFSLYLYSGTRSVAMSKNSNFLADNSSADNRWHWKRKKPRTFFIEQNQKARVRIIYIFRCSIVIFITGFNHDWETRQKRTLKQKQIEKHKTCFSFSS